MNTTRSVAQLVSRLGFPKSDGTASTKGWWLRIDHTGQLVLHFAAYDGATETYDNFFARAGMALESKGYKLVRTQTSRAVVAR